jgi:hypothetical protein
MIESGIMYEPRLRILAVKLSTIVPMSVPIEVQTWKQDSARPRYRAGATSCYLVSAVGGQWISTG